MCIIGLYFDNISYIFNESDVFFENLESSRYEPFWKMCNRNFISIENEDYINEIREIFIKFKKRINASTRFSSKGKILEYTISRTMFDCLASEETEGFFDDSDCPPPEFWISYINGKIFSFIPEEYLDIANLGVDVSMSESLQWATCILEE